MFSYDRMRRNYRHLFGHQISSYVEGLERGVNSERARERYLQRWQEGEPLRLRGGTDGPSTPTKRKHSQADLYPTPTKTPKKQRINSGVSSKKLNKNSTIHSNMHRRKLTARQRRNHRNIPKTIARTRAKLRRIAKPSAGFAPDKGLVKHMKYKKVLHPKQPHHVHVGRRLKKQIEEVIEGEKGIGYFQQAFYGAAVDGEANGRQMVGNILNAAVDGVQGVFFSPTQVLNAASVLWNGKTISTSFALNDATNFTQGLTKIKVMKQWVTVRIRNTSQRNYVLNIYACKPKRTGPAADTLVEWTNALSEDNTLGINVNNCVPKTLHNTPYRSKSFMNNWNVETTKYTLAPGQEVTYTINGPSKVYNYEKYFSGAVQYPSQKDNTYLMFSGYVDLLSTTLQTIGRYAEASSFVGWGLVYEVDEYYQLECPDIAGVKLPGTVTGGAQLPLNNRRDAYAISTDAVAQSGVEQQMLHENPIAGVTGPV